MATNIADAVPGLKRLIRAYAASASRARRPDAGPLPLGHSLAALAEAAFRWSFRGAERMPGRAGNVAANIAALGAARGNLRDSRK